MRINGTDIFTIRGDTISITIECFDQYGDKVILGEGDLLYFTVKDSPNTTVKRIQRIADTFDHQGNAIIEISSVETNVMRFGSYVYDVQWTDVNGVVRTVIPMSKFVVEPGVTSE